MKPMSRRQMLSTMGITATTLALAACGGAPTATPTTAPKPTTAPAAAATTAPAAKVTAAPAAPAAKVTLQYWDMQWGEVFLAALKAKMGDWNKANPNIQVEFNELAWGDYVQKFQSAIAAGSPPDMSGGGGGTPWVFWPQGQLLALDELYDRWKGSGRYNDLVEWGQKKWVYEGKQAAVTWQLDARGIFYRKDLFEKAGLKLPTTHDELLQVATKLTDKSKEQYGIAFPAKAGNTDTTQWIMTLLLQNGGYIADKDGKPAFNTPEWEQSLAFEKKLMDAAAPEGTPSYAFTECQRLYEQGKVAMIFEGGWFIAQTKKNVPEIFKNTGLMAPLKGSGSNAAQRMLAFYNPWMIWKQSKYPKQAIDFLDFMSAPENLKAVYAADLGNKFAPYKSLSNDAMWQQEPMAGELNKQIGPYGVDYYYPFNSNPIGQATLGTTIDTDLVSSVLAGGRAPKDALQAAQTKVEPGFQKK